MLEDDAGEGFHGWDSEKNLQKTPNLENDVRADVEHWTSPDGRTQTVEATVYLPDDIIREQMFICYANNHLIIYGEFDILYMNFEEFTK